MGRKNQRVEQPELDLPTNPMLEPVTVIRRRVETEAERSARLDAEFARRRYRNERRIDARVAAAIDWDVCCIPGCGSELGFRRVGAYYRVVSSHLPLCAYHETIVGLQVEPHLRLADHNAMRERLARRHVEEEIVREAHYDVNHENAGATQGQIYVIRQGGLIKVGWSSKLRSRLKQYGAGVEILAHYPATRAEETGLHQSLRPFLARGREWYQDCQLLADVVAGIIKRHGKPTIFPYWTEPKADLTAKPKGMRSA